MRARGRFAGRDPGMVRVVAVHADLTLDGAGGPIPIAAGPAVGASFPIAVGRSVAAPAQWSAFRKLDLAPVARLELFQVLLVVAVETVVVPVVRPVAHHNVLVLLRDDEVVLRVKPQNRWLVLLMASIAIKV